MCSTSKEILSINLFIGFWLTKSETAQLTNNPNLKFELKNQESSEFLIIGF